MSAVSQSRSLNTMKAVAYLQIIGLVSSLVIRDSDRVRRESSRNVCLEEKQTIYPVVAQNVHGRVKVIRQQNATHSQLQPVEIVKCSHPGSSCTSCSPSPSPSPRVCSNEYKVSPVIKQFAQLSNTPLQELKLLASSDFHSEAYDYFRFPSGCECYTTSQ